MGRKKIIRRRGDRRKEGEKIRNFLRKRLE